MIQNLSLRGGTTFAERLEEKQSQKLGDYAIASFRFASFAMTIGHFITWSTLIPKSRRHPRRVRLIVQSLPPQAQFL
jgi:hypothetical protein